MQSFPSGLIEEMKLSKGERESLSVEIKTEVAGALSSMRPHGWQKAIFILREYGILSSILAVFVGLLAFAGAGWIYAFSRVEKEAKFEQSTGDRLDHIEKAIALLPTQIAAANLANISTSELSAHKNELQELQKRLMASPRDAPNFGPVSFQVIQLLSQATAGLPPSDRPGINLHDVTGFVSGKTVDYPPGSHILLGGIIRDSQFSDAVISFDPNVRLINVTFENCVLVLPISQQPPESIRAIGSEVLMASDLSKMTITNSN